MILCVCLCVVVAIRSMSAQQPPHTARMGNLENAITSQSAAPFRTPITQEGADMAFQAPTKSGPLRKFNCPLCDHCLLQPSEASVTWEAVESKLRGISCFSMEGTGLLKCLPWAELCKTRKQFLRNIHVSQTVFIGLLQRPAVLYTGGGRTGRQLSSTPATVIS